MCGCYAGIGCAQKGLTADRLRELCARALPAALRGVQTTVEDELIEANSKIDTDVAGLEKSKEYFDSKLDEVKSGLKDLIGSVPGLAAK